MRPSRPSTCSRIVYATQDQIDRLDKECAKLYALIRELEGQLRDDHKLTTHQMRALRIALRKEIQETLRDNQAGRQFYGINSARRLPDIAADPWLKSWQPEAAHKNNHPAA